MEIYINKKRAMLKTGTSFEYVSENRLFSGSDDYTLAITFPLRGCLENIKIFGNINRADVSARKIIMDCEIRDRGFTKSGSVTITEINDAEVKVQFLEGRSEQNFDETFDNVYINELDLGTWTDYGSFTPAQAWNPILTGFKCVALPWVNQASGNIQNLAEYNNGSFAWHSDCKGRSWQPYLLYIVKQICKDRGYKIDLSEWEEKDDLKYLLVSNTLPYAWEEDNFASALPHWSVTEFFEKLELFLNCEFDIDHRSKTIRFAFTDKVVASLPVVRLDRVVDEHSVQVTVEEEKCDYREVKNLVYKDCDNEMWKYYSCDWFIKSWKDRAVRYDTLNQLLADNKWLTTQNGQRGRGTNYNKVLYAADVDAYFVVRALSKILIRENSGFMPNTYYNRVELRPLNLFGGRIIDDSEDADQIEIEFVPAAIDDTEEKYGRILFLSFNGYDDTETTSLSFREPTDDYLAQRKAEIDAKLYQPIPVQALEHGEKEQRNEFYNCIYMGWWDGSSDGNGKLPHPFVENIEVYSDWSAYKMLHFSMRLNEASLYRNTSLPKIDPKQKFTFKFLGKSIPNPRSVFIVHGKRYVCEKITATFTENGMSSLLKFEGYPIID